jgi:HlyD family secretion protein
MAMRAKGLKRLTWLVVTALSVVGVTWFAWPRPILVDLATVTTGPMEVTVDDEARTRVRHIYTISAPITGKVLRISNPSTEHDISLHVGDQVIANETVVAVMQPTAPSFLDIRSRAELQAAVAAADAAVRLAEAEVRRIEAILDFSREELDRARPLAATNAISAQALDAAELDVATNGAALESAKAQLELRRDEYELATARLIDPSTAVPPGAGCCVQIRAPATGRVLKVIQQSEAVVAAGTPLVEVGDPLDLEIVADLLSTDAVQIRVGAPVRIDGWGGPPLRGRVTRIEPEGFVKVSALGIEEQRVRTIIDFLDPPTAWSALGNEFRVIVHVELWRAESALTVPVAALFRLDEDWAVFRESNRRARSTAVAIGRRNDRVAEVLAGLSAGDRVVLHPSDRVRDGQAVAARVGN